MWAAPFSLRLGVEKRIRRVRVRYESSLCCAIMVYRYQVCNFLKIIFRTTYMGKLGEWSVGLWQSLMPNEYVASIYDIDLMRLWNEGKRLILTDLDNTLVPWNHPLVSEELESWLKFARGKGFQVCIVSNNASGRVEEFSSVSGLPAVGAAKKPRSDGFYKALAKFEMDPSKAVMVGDQLFTDIRGGNFLGMYTILVLPISSKEWWGTRVTRVFERVAMKRLYTRGLKKPIRRQ